MAHTLTACNGSIHVSLGLHPPCNRTRESKADHPSGGGMPISTNRTLWPVTGGAVGVQPGWFPGHASAFFYINLGEGTIPLNYSLPMQPVFQITGPTNVQYDGSFCLPQVPLPANFTAKIGDNATIQIVETAQHGAALYNVRDILQWIDMIQADMNPSALTSPLPIPKTSPRSTKRTASTAQTSASNSSSAPIA